MQSVHSKTVASFMLFKLILVYLEGLRLFNIKSSFSLMRDFRETIAQTASCDMYPGFGWADGGHC